VDRPVGGGTDERRREPAVAVGRPRARRHGTAWTQVRPIPTPGWRRRRRRPDLGRDVWPPIDAAPFRIGRPPHGCSRPTKSNTSIGLTMVPSSAPLPVRSGTVLS